MVDEHPDLDEPLDDGMADEAMADEAMEGDAMADDAMADDAMAESGDDGRPLRPTPRHIELPALPVIDLTVR